MPFYPPGQGTVEQILSERPSRFLRTRTIKNGERPRRSTLVASGGAVARSSNGSLKLAEVALAPRWDAAVRGERGCLEELQRRVLFLAVPDPAAHPAFLAADLAAAFPSALTGHTFSSGASIKSRARRYHGLSTGVNETLLYNPRTVQSQGLYGTRRWENRPRSRPGWRPALVVEHARRAVRQSNGWEHEQTHEELASGGRTWRILTAVKPTATVTWSSGPSRFRTRLLAWCFGVTPMPGRPTCVGSPPWVMALFAWR